MDLTKQPAKKRKMCCCDTNSKKQEKNKRKASIQCDYCQCTFYTHNLRGQHMLLHQCAYCGSDCFAVDGGRTCELRHEQEYQLEELQDRRQREMDDNFVFAYVKAFRLTEYRPQLDDYEPNFDYILLNYRFEKEEWLTIIKKYKRQFLHSFFGSFKGWYLIGLGKREHFTEQFNAEMFPYLLSNRAMNIQDVADFLQIIFRKEENNAYAKSIVSHLTDNGYTIKAEWVANVINDDELIERIKQKHTFTYDQIHKTSQWDTPLDANGLKMFYTQLQKHFYNSNFENPFDEEPETDYNAGRDRE